MFRLSSQFISGFFTQADSPALKKGSFLLAVADDYSDRHTATSCRKKRRKILKISTKGPTHNVLLILYSGVGTMQKLEDFSRSYVDL